MSLELTAPTPDAPDVAEDGVWLADIETGETYAPFDEIRYTGEDGNLLEVRYADPPTFEDFQGQGRGVWRYRAALPFEEGVTLPEGDTPLHEAPRLREDVGWEPTLDIPETVDTYVEWLEANPDAWSFDASEAPWEATD